MVRTGGTLSAKMIELIGDLNEQKTLSNINKSIRNIEKKLNNDNSKIKLNVELFARVEDMRKDISAIQSKIKNNSSVKDIKLGVGLEDITIKDINEQIAKAQARFGEGKSANTLKLDIEFDFKGSASKIKEEMDGIKQFMQRYGEQMNNMEPVNLGKSAQGVKRDSDAIKGSISNIGSETKKATQGISDQIEKEMRDATQATGKFSVNYKRDVEGTIIGANASIKSADGTMESFKYTLNETGNMLGQQSRATKIAGDATERYAKQVATVEDAQNKLNNAVKNAPEGFSSKAFSDAQANIDKARGSLEQYGKATDVADQAMTSFSNNLKITKKDLKFQEAVNETKNLADEFKRLGGSDEELRRITREIQKLSQDGSSNFDKLQSEIKESISEFQRLDKQMSETSRKEFRTAIEEQDIATVKRYVEEMKGASVASLRLSDAKDKEGNAISRVKVNMEAQNGAIQSSTLEYDKATGKVRELDKTTKTLSESNRGLDNSFVGILSRITQYFSAIQILQKGMQAIKKTISEILEIDAQMIELARVADPSLNLDIMLERSVALSKELGASVSDVVGVVGDMARTFGEFNEEQILAIARTATIMQNVSELNLEQSSSTLVGTMKAFNIQAEDSIKIVNSFNEVDNNFAISTDQIANAMERAGATAQTFGIEMEELIGDITAVGEVTQESGERIGTALRTIYSRVTTHDKAIGMLEEVGISIREMGESGPQLRDVSDILGELGQIWGDLSSAQQQNMALQIAGRNRLTQFLALMNNQATAIDATTTAYNSQGSALREQKEYMQSYEYQMNILGATATDVALSIEDKFVGDAMYLVVTATTSVLEVLDDLIDKFGFLPVALGGATTAVLLFSKSVQGLAIPAVTQSIKGLLEAGMKMNPMISGISTKIFELATSLGPIKALLAGGVGVAGIMAIGWAIEKLVSKMAEAKKANEDAKHSMQEAIDTYRAQGNEINSLIDRYEELHNARKSGELNIEDEREYLDLVNQISTMLPNSISYIDAKGEAHLRSADSIRKEAEVLEGLASANAEVMKHDFAEDLIKMADDMEDAQDRNSKSIKKSETAMQSMNSQYKAYVESSEKASRQTGKEVEILEKEAFMRIYATESMEQYYEQAGITNATSDEMSGLIQQSTVAIGDQTVALLNVGGKMKNTSTTAQALIRDYASMNDGMLQNAEGSKEYLEAQEKIKEQSIVFGEIVSGVYDDISEGLDEFDAQKAIDQFDQLLLALPEEEFQKGFDVIKNNMDGLQSIIGDVASGAEIDIEKVISQLEIAGMETDAASSFVIALGEAFKHQQIRAEVSKETLTEYSDELVRIKDTALEAFNPLEALFGFDSDSMKGLESHVNLLALMKNQYGETWHEMDKGQDSINAMADYFNISSDAIVENFDLYQDAIRAMGKMTTKLDENGKTVVEFGDDVSKATRDVVMGMLEAGDGFGGFADYMVTKTGVITQSQEEIAEKVEEVNDRFSKLGEGPGDRNAKNNLLNTLREDLEELRGSIAYTEDEFGNFKLVMADGTRSAYLDNLNTQIEENNMSLNVRQDAEANWVVDIQNLATGAIDRIASLNEASINGALAVDIQREAVKKLINESTSEEEKKTFIDVLSTQMEAFGEDLDIVGDKTEGFKIQLAEDEQNPWLLGLNNLVEELGIKIDQTKDEAGNLQIEFQTKDGETFFTTAKAEVEELDEKIKDANKSTDELTDPEKDRTVEIDYDDSNVREGLIETEHDIDVVSGAEYYINMDGDNTGIHDAVDDSNKKTDELEDKAVKLEIDADSLKTHNDIRKELHDTRLEIVDLEKALENIKKDLTVTNESMQNLMTNTKNINNAHSAIKGLNEMIDISIGKMGDLYAMFSSDAGIDTSGIENSAQKIADEAHSIERALVSIQGYITGMNLSLKGMDASFDITPITNYRLSVLNNAHLIASDISALAVVVSTQMAKVSEAFKQGNVSLAQVKIHTSNILGQVVILHRLTGEMITNYSLKASSDMLNNYNKGLVGILQATTTFKGLMDNHFKQFYTSMVQKVTMTAVDMRTKFTNGTNDIVKVAEGLPGRIGQGIRNNISQATSSMTALASSMVTRFKRELGIHSPSRVFTELGGHVIDGLVNGLTGSDITNLGQTVFSDFSDGAISTINEIKGYMTFEPVTAGSFGAGFTKTSGFGPRKSPGGIGSTNHRGVDFAAPMGTPIPSQSSGVVTGSGYNGSMGNYIKIRSGDGKEHIYMHQSKRNVGVGQKVGRGQIIGHVGSTGNSTGPHVHYEIRVNGVPIDPTKRFRGFAEGGFVDKKELAWHGEEGLEAIIPLIPERRERGLDLWRQSGEILGMNSDLLKMLMGTRRKSAEYGGSSGFAGLDGEAGEGSSTSGTSGVMKPDTSSIMNALGVASDRMFAPLANDKEKPEALYYRDYVSIKESLYEDRITKANIALKALTEQTLDYREALREVTRQENSLMKLTEHNLRTTVKRQSAIEKELKTLKDRSSHTVEQRKRYNELQVEYDKNIESIMSMENSIKNLNIAMDERKLEIYTDYLSQLSKRYDYIAGSMNRTMAQSQFHLEKSELLDSGDITKQNEIRNDILRESIRLEKTLLNQQTLLRAEYQKAMKSYGAHSEQALSARKEMLRVEDAYRTSSIDRIKKEQEIEGIRRGVAEDGVKALKDYYKQTQSMTEKAVEIERKALNKAHQEKMDRYDSEISKIESVYDAKIRELDDTRKEEDYNKEMSELSSKRAELMSAVSRASRDTSLEGRKRLSELQEELSEINSEIRNAQRDRQDSLYRESIENQKKIQIDAIESEKKISEESQRIRNEQLDKQIEDSKKYADSMINDDLLWKNMVDGFVAGSTTDLDERILIMQEDMASFASGDFSLVSMGYDNLTKEQKAQFQDDVLIDISNSILASNDDLKRYFKLSEEVLKEIDASGVKYGSTPMTGGKRPDVSTSAQLEPDLGGKKDPVKDNRYHTIKRGDNMWDLAQKFYGNPYKWTTIAQANNNLDPRKLQIGKRLLIPFKSGGFTGDWIGDEGRVAMLHKKELVLNEAQTGDILNVAKIIESIAGVIPKMKVNKPRLGANSDSGQGDTYVIDNLNLNMKDFKGSRDDAKRAFDNMAKELKKRGRK